MHDRRSIQGGFCWFRYSEYESDSKYVFNSDGKKQLNDHVMKEGQGDFK